MQSHNELCLPIVLTKNEPYKKKKNKFSFQSEQQIDPIQCAASPAG